MGSKLATPVKAALLMAAAIACGSAAAQTLYKLIDKNGKVTYSEEAPKNFDGQVTKLQIDPKANTATMPKYQPAMRDEKSRPDAAGLDDLKQRVAQRKAALAEAQTNPGEGDIGRMGTAGGGARPVPTESYQKRLAELERAVKEAEEDLQKGERKADPKPEAGEPPKRFVKPGV
jgi:hypothetical protein